MGQVEKRKEGMSENNRGSKLKGVKKMTKESEIRNKAQKRICGKSRRSEMEEESGKREAHLGRTEGKDRKQKR